MIPSFPDPAQSYLLPARFPIAAVAPTRPAMPGERCGARRNHRLQAGQILVALPLLGWCCDLHAAEIAPDQGVL